MKPVPSSYCLESTATYDAVESAWPMPNDHINSDDSPSTRSLPPRDSRRGPAATVWLIVVLALVSLNPRVWADDAVVNLPAGVKADYEAAFKYATDHGLKDKDGFLLVSEAVDRLTWNDRKKAELEKERAALVAKTTKDLEEKNKLATLTPPSARNPLTSKPKEGEFDPFNERTDAKGNKVKVVKSFEEAMAAAATDEDVLKSALGTASFGTVQ